MQVRSAEEIAAAAGIRLITCERGLGKLPITDCVMRWQVAQGRRPGDMGVRESNCRGCPFGADRAADKSITVPEQEFRPGKGGPVKRTRSWEPKVKVAKKPTVRVCKLPGCGQTFEVKGVADANRKYHTDECRAKAQELRPPRPPRPRGPKKLEGEQ